jgi:hypothetical protein
MKKKEESKKKRKKEGSRLSGRCYVTRQISTLILVELHPICLGCVQRRLAKTSIS